ncbi:phospholipase A1 VesT1.02-like [Lucilia sericata]|uniref:phospholipase A1 VesT1.02-like n=1 Tax=Lucilia sericata TaxID=13632 RepID=UPI0018A81E38|nr:phospholipase A1 VesT1.02-like [Lucilia sericata]
MKVLIFLAFGCLTVYASTLKEADVPRVHGENGWYVPQEDGSFNWIDMDKAESYLSAMRNIEDFELTTTPVKYYLYTKSNPTSGERIKADAESINGSKFNSSHPTRFVIHGWTQSWLSGMNREIRDAWLSVGEYNIIIVDWARARLVDYVTSVLAVPRVGEKVASMVDYLVKEHGMSLDTLYVIGHSLGAHVAGYCGKNVKTGQVHAIIGLDPALPLFKYDEPDKRLNSTDAFYVESIQTNGGKLGFLKPIGRGAFYPNGGESQPGCLLDLTGACSHARSCKYYAEAVAEDNFGTMLCENYEDAVAKNCGDSFSSVRMGADRNAFMVGGDFYVPVNKKAPFGMLS